MILEAHSKLKNKITKIKSPEPPNNQASIENKRQKYEAPSDSSSSSYSSSSSNSSSSSDDKSIPMDQSAPESTPASKSYSSYTVASAEEEDGEFEQEEHELEDEEVFVRSNTDQLFQAAKDTPGFSKVNSQDHSKKHKLSSFGQAPVSSATPNKLNQVGSNQAAVKIVGNPFGGGSFRGGEDPCSLASVDSSIQQINPASGSGMQIQIHQEYSDFSKKPTRFGQARQDLSSGSGVSEQKQTSSNSEENQGTVDVKSGVGSPKFHQSLTSGGTKSISKQPVEESKGTSSYSYYDSESEEDEPTEEVKKDSGRQQRAHMMIETNETCNDYSAAASPTRQKTESLSGCEVILNPKPDSLKEEPQQVDSDEVSVSSSKSPQRSSDSKVDLPAAPEQSANLRQEMADNMGSQRSLKQELVKTLERHMKDAQEENRDRSESDALVTAKIEAKASPVVQAQESQPSQAPTPQRSQQDKQVYDSIYEKAEMKVTIQLMVMQEPFYNTDVSDKQREALLRRILRVKTSQKFVTRQDAKGVRYQSTQAARVDQERRRQERFRLLREHENRKQLETISDESINFENKSDGDSAEQLDRPLADAISQFNSLPSRKKMSIASSMQSSQYLSSIAQQSKYLEESDYPIPSRASSRALSRRSKVAEEYKDEEPSQPKLSGLSSIQERSVHLSGTSRALMTQSSREDPNPPAVFESKLAEPIDNSPDGKTSPRRSQRESRTTLSLNFKHEAVRDSRATADDPYEKQALPSSEKKSATKRSHSVSEKQSKHSSPRLSLTGDAPEEHRQSLQQVRLNLESLQVKGSTGSSLGIGHLVDSVVRGDVGSSSQVNHQTISSQVNHMESNLSEQMVLLNLKESQAKTVHQQLFQRRKDSLTQHAPYLVKEIPEDPGKIKEKKERLRPSVVPADDQSSKLASHKTSERYSLGWKNGNCEGEIEVTEDSHRALIASHREASTHRDLSKEASSLREASSHREEIREVSSHSSSKHCDIPELEIRVEGTPSDRPALVLETPPDHSSYPEGEYEDVPMTEMNVHSESNRQLDFPTSTITSQIVPKDGVSDPPTNLVTERPQFQSAISRTQLEESKESPQSETYTTNQEMTQWTANQQLRLDQQLTTASLPEEVYTSGGDQGNQGSQSNLPPDRVYAINVDSSNLSPSSQREHSLPDPPSKSYKEKIAAVIAPLKKLPAAKKKIILPTQRKLRKIVPAKKKTEVVEPLRPKPVNVEEEMKEFFSKVSHTGCQSRQLKLKRPSTQGGTRSRKILARSRASPLMTLDSVEEKPAVSIHEELYKSKLKLQKFIETHPRVYQNEEEQPSRRLTSQQSQRSGMIRPPQAVRSGATSKLISRAASRQQSRNRQTQSCSKRSPSRRSKKEVLIKQSPFLVANATEETILTRLKSGKALLTLEPSFLPVETTQIYSQRFPSASKKNAAAGSVKDRPFSRNAKSTVRNPQLSERQPYLVPEASCHTTLNDFFAHSSSRDTIVPPERRSKPRLTRNNTEEVLQKMKQSKTDFHPSNAYQNKVERSPPRRAPPVGQGGSIEDKVAERIINLTGQPQKPQQIQLAEFYHAGESSLESNRIIPTVMKFPKVPTAFTSTGGSRRTGRQHYFLSTNHEVVSAALKLSRNRLEKNKAFLSNTIQDKHSRLASRERPNTRK